MKMLDNRLKGKEPIGRCEFGSVVETADGVCIVSDVVEKCSVVAVRLKDGKSFTYQLPECVTKLNAMVTINYSDKEFPLLIKIIDAKEDLSVQVHPNDNYALEHHNSLGKFECWYFLNQNEATSCIAGIDASKQLDVKKYIDSGILQDKQGNCPPHNSIGIYSTSVPLLLGT